MEHGRAACALLGSLTKLYQRGLEAVQWNPDLVSDVSPGALSFDEGADLVQSGALGQGCEIRASEPFSLASQKPQINAFVERHQGSVNLQNLLASRFVRDREFEHEGEPARVRAAPCRADRVDWSLQAR